MIDVSIMQPFCVHNSGYVRVGWGSDSSEDIASSGVGNLYSDLHINRQPCGRWLAGVVYSMLHVSNDLYVNDWNGFIVKDIVLSDFELKLLQFSL